jgi:hypothetical protein
MIHGFPMSGIVGINSILGGSSAWGTLSIGAAVVGGLDGCFLFILNKNGRSGGVFGGRTLLGSNPRSQSSSLLSLCSTW